MLIIPAIDLKAGKVVRLAQGEFDKQKIYSRSALKVAKHWARCGAEFMHIVDLDGASCGKSKNLAILRAIIEKVGVPVEFGGGVRDLKTIKQLINLGAQRVVLGTKAATDLKFLKNVFELFGQKVIVSVDAKAGVVLTEGWRKSKGLKVLDFAKQLKAIGFQQLIYTDINRDGMLCGPNIAGIKQLLLKSGLRIVASGGVSSLADLIALKKLEKKGVAGVIIGKALYEGKFTLEEALLTV